jgi:dipeptidyl-peptidase-4
MTCLWELDVATGKERLVADPRAVAPSAEEDLSDAERALRERTRHRATGIVGYATDTDVRQAGFVLGGVPWAVELSGGDPVRLDTPTPAMQARPDSPTPGCALAAPRHERRRIAPATGGRSCAGLGCQGRPERC